MIYVSNLKPNKTPWAQRLLPLKYFNAREQGINKSDSWPVVKNVRRHDVGIASR